MTPAELSELIRTQLLAAIDAGEITLDASDVPDQVKVERPRQREHGDWATNIAMQLAKKASTNPRALAQVLADRLTGATGIDAVEIAGPGFINIRLAAGAAGELARSIIEAGENFGRSDALAGERINLEYISANPTGPLHIGHTRWAAVGDALVRVLRAAGAEVSPEYYINDAGNQMNTFGASVLARAKGEEIPEDGYPGEYIDDLAKQALEQRPDLVDLPNDEAIALARELGYAAQLQQIKDTLADFNVEFDVWFSEKANLHDTSAIAEAIDRLREQGNVYDDGGAVWLRTTDYGDDKDRVLVKADGSYTYFAADCAYYLSKRDRGFSEKIYLFGADHHGYVGRMKAVAACAGDDMDKNIEILIGQFINISGGRMGKRLGNVINLHDLIEWIGTDALRYTLARYPTDTTLDLKAEDLQQQNNDNPVYYVQYAHARTRNVARNAAEQGVRREDAFDASLLTDESESNLLGMLAEYPRVVALAAENREVHRIARYLEDLASAYHTWYGRCRVTPRGDEAVDDTHRTRLWLNDAVTQVLRNGLDILGVSAPDRM
ncbi:arginine--tRNA ligase [Bowdeniella nasicola]|uniref:Arginine--tRNA ligase n=1 Tax=Bowdeniella nasicola TaxID=208480 RepID=A0A1Q5Q375_9ACTO|nr:arginine--tRNA ligase [Bowdeniella nasicola]OKL54215.1 arginine--tRNA ligase [Bowdeniella nasicola]